MRIRIIALTIGIGLLMNGCLADKLRARIYYLKMRDGSYKKVKRKKQEAESSLKVNHTKTIEKKRVLQAPMVVKKPLYTPSPAEPLVMNDDEVEVVAVDKSRSSYEHNLKQRKKHTTQSAHRTKKKRDEKRKKKRVHKKKTKKSLEPYSIESDQSDPELLGPQTTLESNPLKKESNNI